LGLAYLLGIRLLPRIRNWKDQQLYRPSAEAQYRHIDELFTTRECFIKTNEKAGRISHAAFQF